MEMIDNLFKVVGDKDEGIFSEVLMDYYESSNVHPEHIIIFRDGVSESQFIQVLNIELQQIIEACKFKDTTRNPKFTLIVAQKNHHTKFFQPHSADNVPPGTVVDNGVCHPKNYDFYMCSQAGMIGTTRPTHYHVLYDEIGFSPDDLQALVHSLSYVYQRSTTAISVVAPICYAHLAAAQVSQFVKFDDFSDRSSSHGGSSQGGADAAVPQLPVLHKDVKKIIDSTGPGSETIELIKDPQNPSRNRGFAFVEYYNNTCADYSRQKMSSARFKLDGNTPTVTWADPKQTSDSSAASSQVKALYLKNIPDNTTTEELKELFQIYGEVTKVVMPPAKSGGKGDFGFVHYAERSSALKAVNEKYEVHGQMLDVVLAKPQSDKRFASSNPHNTSHLPNYIPHPGYAGIPVNPYASLTAGYQQQPMIYGRGPMPSGMQMVPMVLPEGQIGYVLHVFKRICKNKSTEDFHPYPYLATTMNYLLWVFYGLPIVHPDSTLVVTINGIGLALEACYLSIFFYYTTKKYRVSDLK